MGFKFNPFTGNLDVAGAAGSSVPGTSPLTTKGDLYTYAAADERLAVGTADGHVLKVDSSTATGLAWGAAAGTNSFVVNESPSGTPNGTLTAFVLANTPVTNTEQIFRDGQLMTGGTADYSMANGTINFVAAPAGSSVIKATYQLAGASSGNADTVDNFHASTTPTVGYIPVLDSAMAMIGYGMGRQAIINGNFDVWQRGTSGTGVGGGVTTADRWQMYATADGGTLPTITQSRQTLTAGDLLNSFYHFRIAPDGAGSSLGNATIGETYNKIEYGTRNLCGNGKKVTVSFWARASVAGKKLGVMLEQSYGSGGSPTATEVINGTNFTLTSSWAKYTYTFTTNTLAGKTFGTANDDSLILEFWYAWGSTFQSRFGAGSAENFGGSGTIDIAQVQLCAGDVALPFMPKSYNQELLDCYRYYYRITSQTAYSIFGVGNVTGAGGGTFQVKFPVTMRLKPAALEQSGTAANYAIDQGAGAIACSANPALNANTPTNDSCTIDMTIASGGTAGRGMLGIANNNTTAYLGFNAEL